MEELTVFEAARVACNFSPLVCDNAMAHALFYLRENTTVYDVNIVACSLETTVN